MCILIIYLYVFLKKYPVNGHPGGSKTANFIDSLLIYAH